MRRSDSLDAALDSLCGFLDRHARLFVLTGAGCSTGSGIPDYRDADGNWKRTPPVNFKDFMGSAAVRQRYWARSFVGWPRFCRASPNTAHHALAALERQDRVNLLVTQNVDGLHQAAGSRRVIDLHGRIDRVRCTDCGATLPRATLQEDLLRSNPEWHAAPGQTAPDGDADIAEGSFENFVVPGCAHCGGELKPDVVFFGESVPRAWVEQAMRGLERADAMLVVGSSLMVYSGYRFVQAAVRTGKPVAAINVGRTRADELLTVKVSGPCAETLSALIESR
ncbi:MAG: NAD-dependent protein deacetylase [Steroidobacteraceae bacterium]|nr:NAD-dependent protein deacetylase [Steroidobacteraceae bacterium]